MIQRRKAWYLLFISTMIVIWLYPGMAYSQSTSQYTLKKSVIDGGGGVRSSVSYILSHSIGQPSGIGTASTSQYTLHAGFYGSIYDACPDDPDKIAPGICGCGVPDTDSDNDGTPDCNDGCPNDPTKVEPGICGCGIPDTDSDNDGTPDCNDGCPNDPGKIDPGICGCDVPDTDSDNDGTPDCNDGCPNDPGKIEPGVCGCGIPDTDSDNDGTPDCNDGCPDDPDKTEPGVCGCGIPDTDSDNDGTPDCNDGCPDDPNKIEPGVCGCGIPDTDSDNDGTPDCSDNCPDTYNPDQEDADGDGIGDLCEQGDVSISNEQDFVDRGDNSVYRGDIISYTITATNFFEDTVVLMISDAISALVDYVADSLKIYEAGKDVTPEDDMALWQSDGLLGYESGLLDYGETLTLSFDVEVKNIADFGAMIENVAWVTAYFPGSSQPIIFEKQSNVVMTEVKENPIPEPSTMFFLGVGLFALFVLGCRRWFSKR